MPQRSRVKFDRRLILSLYLLFFALVSGLIMDWTGLPRAQAASYSRLIPEINDSRSRQISNSSTELVPANRARTYLLIQNVGAVNIGIAIGDRTAAIGSAGTTTLAPLGALSFEDATVATNAFNAIAASGTPDVTVWEIIGP